MELKLENVQRMLGHASSLNRTFMELKLDLAIKALHKTWVLIEPLWNWNEAVTEEWLKTQES